MTPEEGVPATILKAHIGTPVLYRLPNNALPLEGVIHELSPGEQYIRVRPHRWVANGTGMILAFLGQSHRRRDAIK